MEHQIVQTVELRYFRQLRGSGSSFGAASDEPSYLKILTFVGAGLVFLGSWFPRIVYYNMAGEKEAAGLFASDGGILKFYALLFIIIAAGSVCLEVLPNHSSPVFYNAIHQEANTVRQTIKHLEG